jgi:hypothetical protein
MINVGDVVEYIGPYEGVDKTLNEMSGFEVGNLYTVEKVETDSWQGRTVIHLHNMGSILSEQEVRLANEAKEYEDML